MGDRIWVSVVVPVYNSMPYLKDCIESLINQTLKDIELIFVDDRGTDNSVGLIKRYQDKDDRIKILHNSVNMGAGASRNRGIAAARGEYIAIFDADDVFELSMLEAMYQRAEETKADIVVCDFVTMDETGKDLYERRIPRWFVKRWDDDELLRKEENQRYSPAVLGAVAWNKLLRKEFVLKNNLQFQQIYNCDDVFFSATALMSAGSIAYLGRTAKPMIHYRNGGVNSQSKNIRDIFTGINAAKAVIKYVNAEENRRKYRGGAFSISFKVMTIWLNRLNSYQRNEFLSRIPVLTMEEMGLASWRDGDYLSIHDRDAAKKLFEDGNKTEEDFLLAITTGLYLDESIRPELKEVFGKGKYALWGYGAFGKQLLSEENRVLLDFSCIVDKSPTVIGTKVGNLEVKAPSKGVLEEIDAIVVPNSNYVDSVLADLKKMDCDIPIFDIVSFLRFGIPLEECIYKWK